MQDSNDLNSVEKILSQEEEQERSTSAPSYLTGANTDYLRQREREYRDVEKHFVRQYWLSEAKKLVEVNKRKLRYLTLPAYFRLDVTLFDKHNLIAHVPADSKTVLDVAGFETDPTKYGRMQNQSPSLQLLGCCPIEDAILDTSNRHYEELHSLFPFDLINLDLTTSLTPHHEGPFSKIMMSIEEIMLRQAGGSGQWGMFLTFRNVLGEWEKYALKRFLDNLQENISKYPAVKDAFKDRYQYSRVEELFAADAEKSVSQAVLKWLTDRANYYRFKVERVKSFHYLRSETTPHYRISKLLLVFSRKHLPPDEIPMKQVPRQSWMDENLVLCVREHKFLDVGQVLHEKQRAKLEQEIKELCGLVETDSGVATDLSQLKGSEAP